MTIKLRAIENHQGEGTFPEFKKGTFVTIHSPCAEYENWFACEIEGYQTYISAYLLKENHLICDYNPTEIVAETGTAFKLLSLYGEWLYVENIQTKEKGWFPAAKMIST